VWSAGQPLSLSTAADDYLGAITPDELTIAWVAVGGGSTTVFYADRTSKASAFGTPGSLVSATDYYAAPKVALSPDGLRIVVVRSDNSAIGVVTRASRSATFAAAPGGGEVDNINHQVSGAESVFYVADPVIGAADQTFYYSLYGQGITDSLLESTRTDTSAWPGGSPLTATGGAFAASGSTLRHPTGVSSDDLTLFYWDDPTSSEKAAWRSPASASSFGHVETLGSGFRGAAPNQACDTLYYSASGDAGGLDLYVSTRQ
jgi:hypothetical protein